MPTITGLRGGMQSEPVSGVVGPSKACSPANDLCVSITDRDSRRTFLFFRARDELAVETDRYSVDLFDSFTQPHPPALDLHELVPDPRV